MAVPLTLAALLVAPPLGAAAGTSRLGHCVDGTADCRWRDYLRDTLLLGLSGWVVAGLVLIFFVVYMCLLCVSRNGAPQRDGHLRSPELASLRSAQLRAPTISNLPHQPLHWHSAIRVLAWVAVLLAVLGLAILLTGWFQVSDSWSSVWGTAATFATSLTNLMLVLQAQLLAVQRRLVNPAASLELPALRAVVPAPAVSATAGFAAATAHTLQNVQDVGDAAFLVTRWALLAFSSLGAGLALTFALLTLRSRTLRCSSRWLTGLGLVSNVMVWLSVGVVVVGCQLLSDTCDDLSTTIQDRRKGIGLLSQLGCNQNTDAFSAVYDVYSQGVVSLNQSFCVAVMKSCQTNSTSVLSSCACRSDGDTERFLAETYIYGDPQCAVNCTVATCALRCSRASQLATAAALTDLSAARAMLQSNQPLAQTVQTCQYFVDQLFPPEEALCSTFEASMWLVISGQIILGAAGMLCNVCLLLHESGLLPATSPAVVPHDVEGGAPKIRQ